MGNSVIPMIRTNYLESSMQRGGAEVQVFSDWTRMPDGR